MKSKLVLLIIPFMFFACEEETDEGPADPTLVGSWTASVSSYNSPDCSADSLEFSGTGTATYTETTLMAEYTFSIGTFEDFCTEAGGTLNGVGDSCTVSAYGYSMSIDESYFADSLCIPAGGAIGSDGACMLTETATLDYTIDGTDYCETIDAGTDSSETDCGTIDLSATSATITFSDDSTCTVIELSK
jgi:hypothetical protein